MLGEDSPPLQEKKSVLQWLVPMPGQWRGWVNKEKAEAPKENNYRFWKKVETVNSMLKLRSSFKKEKKKSYFTVGAIHIIFNCQLPKKESPLFMLWKC